MADEFIETIRLCALLNDIADKRFSGFHLHFVPNANNPEIAGSQITIAETVEFSMRELPDLAIERMKYRIAAALDRMGFFVENSKDNLKKI